jgi:hypothetical protein
MLERMGKYEVRLSDEERVELSKMVSRGNGSARAIRRANILLKSDAGWSDEAIGQALNVSRQTIHDVRQQCVTEGVVQTLTRKPGPRPQPRLDGVAEAHLIALTCGEPPEGRARWTLRLLAGRMVELGYVDEVSHETVRQVLKKTHSNRG